MSGAAFLCRLSRHRVANDAQMELDRMPGDNAMKFRVLLIPLVLAACTVMPDSSVRASASATSLASASFTSLPHFHWQLHEAVDGNHKRLDGLFGSSGKPLQLDFTDRRISVRNACNGIDGDYHVVEERLDVAPMMHTMMACADPVLMERERTITSMLQGKPTLILSSTGDAPLLTLTDDDGRKLTFEGKPTAETRYGGAGETMFLEVSPQTVPCDHPLMPDRHCLRVRELHYDAHGLRTGKPGPWQPLPSDIEGFTHRSGERNVLRVKRYTLDNVPADAPSVAYELDMVVESETVKPPR
jgi:heat shock protein HslJ